MDSAQIVLLLVLIVLTVLLLILGIQVFFILRDFRRTINKANKVLDDTGVITESVSGPISNLSSVGSAFKTGMALISFLTKGKKQKNKKGEDSE